MIPEDLPLTPEEIAEAIRESGRTKEEVGQLLGLGGSAISKWIKGKTRPEPHNADAFRKNLTAAPTHRAKFAAYLARAQVRAAANRGHPPQPPPMVDPKALLDTIARDLADKLAPVLKVDVGELAKLLADKFDAKGIAPTVAGQLLPELREVVDELAQKFAARVEGQEDAIEWESQITQNTQARAEDRAKLAELGTGMGQLQAQADALKAGVGELKIGMQGLRAKTDELGKGVKGLDAKTNAHHEQTGHWLLALGGIMVAGFAGVIVTVVACAHAGGPIPGAGQTRGGGVAEEAARGSQRESYGARTAITGELGERKTGRLMPHQPLPHQATGTCTAGETSLFGACWLEIAHQQPPCLPGFYEHGNACYAPVAADPNIPVGAGP